MLSLTQGIVRSSQRFGEKVAVVAGSSKFMWHECADRISKLARVLLDNGLERDGRVLHSAGRRSNIRVISLRVMDVRVWAVLRRQ